MVTESKLEFFYKPGNIADYLRGRNLVEVNGISRSDLVERIEALPPDESLLLEHSPIPYGPTPPNFKHSLNFLKRGKELYLPVPSAARDCDESTAPVHLRRAVVSSMDPDENYSGFTWRGLRSDDHKKRKVHLDDCLAAGKLFAYAANATGNDRIRVREYDDVRDVETMGAVYVCEVPSRSSDRKYVFQLRSVPIPRTKGEYAVWTNLDTKAHDCELTVRGRFTFRDKAHQVTFCAHEVAAYYAVAKHRYARDGKLMVQPFPLFTQEMVDYWKKLHGQVLTRDPYTHPITGKTHMRRRPLNMAEREALLHSKVALRGHEAMLFARRKIQDYDWQ